MSFIPRPLLIGVGLGTIPVSLALYDKWECDKIRQKYMQVASRYGQVPLSVSQKPTTLTILAEGLSRDELTYQYDLFHGMIQPFWTASGIDYDWLEASQTKHAQEAVKLYKDQQQSKDYSKEDPVEENVHWKSLETSIPEFKNLTAWRLSTWLEHHTAEIASRKLTTPVRTFWSWIWGSSAQDTVVVERIQLREPSKDELALNVKRSLLPQNVDAVIYQQGIVAADSVGFHQMLGVYRTYLEKYPREFSDTFGTYPFRVSFIPLREYSGFWDRLYHRFFNQRDDLSHLAAFALGFITETQELWSDRLEDEYPPENPKQRGLLNGKVLLVKPAPLE